MSRKRKPSKDLTLKDLEIMQSQEVEDKTYPETMAELGVSRNAIADAKKKLAYRELVIAALKERGETAETFASMLKQMFTKKKVIVVAQQGTEEVDDNKTQLTALLKFGDILGVDAPREFDLKHTMATMSDDDIQKALNISIEELDGRIQNQITGTSDSRAAITNTVIVQEPKMAAGPGE